MERLIIFDYNRTIYDPETSRLAPFAKRILQNLKGRGFRLALITHARDSRRELIHKQGLEKYFAEILITTGKSRKNFQYLLSAADVDKSQSYVVGDRVRQEIRIGNQLKLNTIWVKDGRFAEENPRSEIEVPTHTVRRLRDISKIIR